MLLRKILGWALVASAAAAASPAAGVPLDSDQRTCVLEVNRGGARVSGAQANEALRCIARAAAGQEADADACLVADARGKVARARERLAERAERRCADPLPPFAYTGPSPVAEHAASEAAALSADLFGNDLSAALVAKQTSKPAAACQAAVARESERLLGAVFELAGRAKQSALAGAAPAEDAAALAEAIGASLAADAGGKAGRAAEKLRRRSAAKCAGADLAALFPGACGGAADAGALAACAAAETRCRACRSVAAFDEIPLDCDAFDDALANGSCTKFALPFLPELVASTVTAEGDADVVPTSWIGLEFAAAFPAERLDDIALRCDGAEREVRVLAGAGSSLFVVPAEPLPADAACELVWPASDGTLAFATGSALPVALYDRSDTLLIAPFPDDALLVDDPLTGTGKRIALEPPPFPDLLGLVAAGISAALARRDGFSPQQPLVFGFSDALDPATVPQDAAASLDPAASIGLFDIDPLSPDFGERVPFTARLRSDAAPGGSTDHSLILLPAIDLRAGGHYTLAITRDAHAAGGQPVGPSGFFERVLLGDASDAPEVLHARAALAPALSALETFSPAIPAAELALAVAIRVRSEYADPSDWVSVKEQLLAEPGAVLIPSETEVRANDVVHRGTLELPLWIEDGSLTEVVRETPGGPPVAQGTDSVPFVMRIPTGAPTPMPIVIYQHGSPGSPDEILGGNSNFLIQAGYAMLGIQDLSNRRFGEDTAAQTTQIIGRLAFLDALPLTNFQTNADMLALLRAIQEMGQPGNFPEIDPTRILYRGISFGAHHSLGFLPFAPEVTAAASHVGSGRLFHANLHQLDYNGLLLGILDALPGARPRDVIAGFAALQNEQDRDDSHLLARHLYREPLAIAGLADTTPPSLLWIEGIGDSLVPNEATRASAVELGIPTVRPVPGPSPVLDEVDPPLSGNVAPGITAGHFQYDPALTPSCVLAGQTEGHFCAQGADEVDEQVLHFYSTALGGTAEIISPLP